MEEVKACLESGESAGDGGSSSSWNLDVALEPAGGTVAGKERNVCAPAKSIAVVNQKGGVGKTTTVLNLSAALAERGHRVLIVDMDPQANLTISFGLNPEALPHTTYEFLLDEVAPEQVITETRHGGLHLIPSDIRLAAGEVRLAEMMMGETVLKVQLEGVSSNYDFILIDSPPNLGLLTINSLVAATEALVPVQTQYFSLKGIKQLLGTFKLLRTRMNHKVNIRLLPTMVDRRINLSKMVLREIRENFSLNRFETVIRTDAKLSESPIRFEPVLSSHPKTRGSRDYRKLALEVVEWLRARGKGA
jgi:chromosome partitioning protein